MEKVEYSESTSATIKQILKDANLASKKYWKVNASPEIWDMQKLPVGNDEYYSTISNKGNRLSNYGKAKKGELVLGYVTGDKIIVSLLVVSQPDDGSKIYFKKILDVQPEFLNLEEVNSSPITKDAFKPYQTTFKDISMDVFAEIISMMIQKGVLTLADFKTAINSIPSLIGGNEDSLSNIENNKDKDMKNNSQNESSLPLNLILYGPPGTGKTYNTLFHALAIIENKKMDDLIGTYCPGKNSESNLSEDEYKKLKDEFDQKVNSGQIVFTTFHQSMSYEDFIEGIKPVVEGNEMTYKVRDGIFKKISEKAEKAKICYWIDLFVQSVEEIKNKIQIKTTKNQNPFEVWHDRKDSPSLSVKPDGSKAKKVQTISINDHLKKYVLKGDSEGDNNWPSYTPAIIDHIIKTYKNKKDLGYPPYVLIIDEINRGNVAQIFGELITLIEPSKRLDNSEEMKAILPYSSAQKGKPEYFGVPNNLYIIGTMNTADRSVEALDTALRRRFSFEEMMPKPELLKDENNQDIKICEIELSNLLKTINDRIVALKDREHRIGHSYFMGLKTDSDLKDVFKDKIIPLLQEYFYGDYKKIYYVLGPGFVEKKAEKTIFAVENPDYDEFDIPEERYDIASFDAKFNIKDAIEKIKVQKFDSGTGTMSTEATTIVTGATTESEESTDKEK